jgi:hypothetical protein
MATQRRSGHGFAGYWITTRSRRLRESASIREETGSAAA